MNNQSIKRVCKKCQSIKNIIEFSLTNCKKETTVCRRHTCKLCEKASRKSYFVEYHKKNYKHVVKVPKVPKVVKPKRPRGRPRKIKVENEVEKPQ